MSVSRTYFQNVIFTIAKTFNLLEERRNIRLHIWILLSTELKLKVSSLLTFVLVGTFHAAYLIKCFRFTSCPSAKERKCESYRPPFRNIINVIQSSWCKLDEYILQENKRMIDVWDLDHLFIRLKHRNHVILCCQSANSYWNGVGASDVRAHSKVSHTVRVSVCACE